MQNSAWEQSPSYLFVIHSEQQVSLVGVNKERELKIIFYSLLWISIFKTRQEQCSPKWTYTGNLLLFFQCLKVGSCMPYWLKFLTHISFKSLDLPLGLSLQWKWTSWTFNLEVMCAHNGFNLGEPKAEIAGGCWRSDCFPHCEQCGYAFPR